MIKDVKVSSSIQKLILSFQHLIAMFGATVDHELGHQIAKLTNAHNDYEMQEMYSRFMSLSSTQRGEVLSGYAGESIHEFIAEGWSEYRNNPNCRPLAKSISNRLFDLYNQHTPRLVKVRR